MGFFNVQMDIRQEIKTRQQASFNNLRTKRLLWDDLEMLFHNQLNDHMSLKGNSRVFDPRLTTLTLERAYRVMGQMPVGKVKPISNNDEGTGKLMNLILDKYIVPNANAQFDFLTKLRMVDIYSNIYGCFYTLVDWDVKANGYIGPDIWLLNIRDVFPQVGAVSITDSDHIIIRTWKPMSYYENLKPQNGYKNIDKIITKLKDKSGSKDTRDSENTSKREEDQYPEPSPSKKDGYFENLTQFEGDRWVDYCVDADLEFRDIKNPHDNGELPVTCKYSIPLLDDQSGMGDFERGKSMQMVVNSNWNLYLRAVEMSVAPPIAINKNAIAENSSIQYIPAAKWMFNTSVSGAISPIQLNPQGIATFNNTQQAATGALLNMFGTTDTTITNQTESGFGKTPQALKMQSNRESTRDNADRYYMEMYIKDTIKKMINLVGKKQSKAITIRLFNEEINQLSRSYPEIQELYDANTGKLSINKGKTGSTLFDYEIVSGSAYAQDQQSQQEMMTMLLDMFMKAQTPQGNQLVEMLKVEGWNFKFGELFKRIISGSNIQGWDKILEERTEEEMTGDITNTMTQQFNQVLAEAAGQMNQIPPQPQGQQQQQPMPMEQPMATGGFNG